MSKWNHRICNLCWEEYVRQHEEPGRQAVRLLDTGYCCFCGHKTDSGIFIREDPANVGCGGTIGDHEREV